MLCVGGTSNTASWLSRDCFEILPIHCLRKLKRYCKITKETTLALASERSEKVSRRIKVIRAIGPNGIFLYLKKIKGLGADSSPFRVCALVLDAIYL